MASEKIEKWVGELSIEQVRPLLAELIEYAIDSELVCFPFGAPYWDATGEPLIEGQDPIDD